MSGIPESEAIAWITQVEMLRRECGCKLSAYSLLATIPLFPLGWGLTLGSSSWNWPLFLLWPIACLFAAAAGKALGVARARSVLRRRIAAMHRRIATLRAGIVPAAPDGSSR
jgi:hypothetical protein